jgi:excisionase family DNA binding protein
MTRPTPLATISEVAAYLRVSTKTVRRAIRDGKLPAYKAGDQYRIDWRDVGAYLRRL